MTGGLVGFLIVIVAIVILIITIHRRRHSETFMKREVSWFFTHRTILVISLLISLFTQDLRLQDFVFITIDIVSGILELFFVVFNVILFQNWNVLSKMLLTPWCHKKLWYIVSINFSLMFFMRINMADISLYFYTEVRQ